MVGAVFEVKRLRLLVELSRRGTIAAVAHALSFSPSAVSQQLSVLEREAGTHLLEPDGRRLRLTPEGELLVKHATTVLAQLERAHADLASLRGDVTGTVKVAAFQSAIPSLVLHAVTLMTDGHPDCRLEVTELEPETALPALAAGDFDLVLAEEYPGHPLPVIPGADLHELTTDPLELAVPTTWDEVTTLEALAGRPLALEPHGTTSRTWATALCRTTGFEPDIRYTSTDLQIHLRIVQEGLAAALLPGLAEARHSDGVITHPLPGRPHRRILTATRVGSREHPRIAATHQALKTAAAGQTQRQTRRRLT